MVSFDCEIPESKELYYITFQIDGYEFCMSKGIEDPRKTLSIARELKAEGYTPQITRQTFPDTARTGYSIKEDSNREELTIKRLEEIVLDNELLSTHKKPTIV